MKYFILLFVLILGISELKSQNYLISFMGSGLTSSVDSVKVENITQGSTLTLQGTDVLHLCNNIGINEVEEENGIFKITPNPIINQAEIIFYAKKSGKCFITIYNLEGKTILKRNNDFSQAIQKYRLSNLNQGVYIIEIKGDNYFYSDKIISQSSDFGKLKLDYLGEESSINRLINKNSKSVIGMNYYSGDSLLFTGFYNNLSSAISDVPTSNNTIVFSFISLPTITTTAVSLITGTSALSGGVIINNGGTPITNCGICWSLLPSPTIANNHTIDSIGSGNYVSQLSGLAYGVTYYIRAYACNIVGISYGNELSFVTNAFSCGTNTVTDIDGNVYNTIQIGNQCWLRENLKVKHYRNGDSIANVSDSLGWQYLSTGAFCSYGNLQSNASVYGLLYNGFAVNDARNIAPVGWHVPSGWDATNFYAWAGGANFAGGNLKESDTIHWLAPNTGATNVYNFTALPGGMRAVFGNFLFKNTRCQIWTSENLYNNNILMKFLYNDAKAYQDQADVRTGLSVRCIKD